jgi:hypothetical protein
MTGAMIYSSFWGIRGIIGFQIDISRQVGFIIGFPIFVIQRVLGHDLGLEVGVIIRM